jgi:hypothetical protein
MITAVKPVFHVVPSQQFWALTKVGELFPLGTYLTKTEALSSGIAQARAGAGLLYVHGRDGQFKEVRNYSYGHWPAVGC